MPLILRKTFTQNESRNEDKICETLCMEHTQNALWEGEVGAGIRLSKYEPKKWM